MVFGSFHCFPLQSIKLLNIVIATKNYLPTFLSEACIPNKIFEHKKAELLFTEITGFPCYKIPIYERNDPFTDLHFIFCLVAMSAIWGIQKCEVTVEDNLNNK